MPTDDKNGAQPEPSDLLMVTARNDSLGPDPALPASLPLLYLLEAHQLWWSRGGARAGADVILLLLFPQHFRRLPVTQAFPLWLHFRRLLLPLGNSWKLQDAILSGISG